MPVAEPRQFCPDCGTPMKGDKCPICSGAGEDTVWNEITRIERELKSSRSGPAAQEKLPDLGDLRKQLARIEERPDEAEGMRLLGTIRQALRQLEKANGEYDERRRAVAEWEQQLTLVERSLQGREEVLKQIQQHEKILEAREEALTRKERAAKDLVESMALGKEFEEADTVLARVREYEGALAETDRLLRDERALFQKWLNRLELQQSDLTDALTRFSRLARDVEEEKSRLGGRLAQMNSLSQQLEVLTQRAKAAAREAKKAKEETGAGELSARTFSLQQRERRVEEEEKRLDEWRAQLEETATMQDKYRGELESWEKRVREKDEEKPGEGDKKKEKKKGKK